MMKDGRLIRHMFPHRAWPYPRGERQVRQVIVVALLLVLVALVCLIAGLKYEDEKTLRSRDVYFAAKSMMSYSSELHLIATKAQKQPLIGPYREVYVQQLSSNVSGVKDMLATHESAGEAQPQVVRLIDICNRLSDLLDIFVRHPDDKVFAAHAAELRILAEQAKAIEESL